MNNLSGKIILVNAFGTLGYFSCIFSWGWAALLYLSMLLGNKYLEDFLLPTPPEEVVQQPVVTESSPFMMLFALVVTVIVVIATVIILVKIPMAVARTGKTVTTKAAESAIPLVTKHQPLPPAKKKRLTVNLIKIMKLFLVLIPIGVILLGTFIELPLPYEIVVLISGILSFFSLFWFSLQYIFARLLKVDAGRLV